MIYVSASLSELKHKLKRNLYCFGAGKAFDYFINEFSYFNLENYITAVVDNHLDTFNVRSKWVNNVCIPIISLEQMISEIEEDDCILITTKAFEEIIEQLEKIEKLKNTKFYIYSIIRTEQYDYNRLHTKVPLCLGSYKEQRIPQTIHYCWFGKKELPNQYKKWIESWKHFCPDYEIIEWNEENYDIHKCRYVSQAYDMKKWAFVSDYARIDIVNEYGGVYLDTDVELLKNIDELLKNQAFCGFESNKNVAYGLGFGARKNNQILGEIKEYYEHTEFILADGSLNLKTSPVIQTEIMKKRGLKCNGEYQIVDGMAVYPPRILCGMSLNSFRVERNLEYTYAIHHFEGSWLEDTKAKSELISIMKKWGDKRYYRYLDESL